MKKFNQKGHKNPYKTLEQTLDSMLKENTGVHMLDSGGDNGRAWQRNQDKDFESEPMVDWTLDEYVWTLKKDGEFIRRAKTEDEIYHYLLKCQPQSTEHAMRHEGYTIEKAELDSSDIDFVVSTYHHLKNSLELDDLCNEFNRKKCLDWDSDKAYGISKGQEQWLTLHGLSFGDSWNSYNGDSNLSQTIQGNNMLLDADSSALEYPDYVLLQIHNGADVRGGYTNAKLFKLTSEYFDTNPTVYGTIDGVEVSTEWDGNTLKSDTKDDNSNTTGVVPVTKDSRIELYLV